MKPAPFRYAAPYSTDDAVAVLETHGPEAKILAGGQSLVPLMNMRLVRPAVLVDLNRIAALSYIRVQGEVVAVGAMTRQRSAELSPIVQQRLPLVAEGLRFIGHPQIRNRGTIGGSLAHADPSGELPAIAAVVEATFVIRGPRGTRTLPAREFFISYLTTALAPDELLEEVRFPAHEHWGTAFLEVARRHGDYALVGVAALVAMLGDRCREARLCFTGVGPTPVRIPDAEAPLAGTRVSNKVLTEVAQLVTDGLSPENDIHASATYRKQVAGVLAERALRIALERAQVASPP